MKTNILEANAALSIAVILIIWLFMLFTNFRRVYRIPLVVCAMAAGFVLFGVNEKIITQSHTPDAARWWYENAGLVVAAGLVAALLFAVAMQVQWESKRHGVRGRHHHAARVHR